MRINTIQCDRCKVIKDTTLDDSHFDWGRLETRKDGAMYEWEKFDLCPDCRHEFYKWFNLWLPDGKQAWIESHFSQQLDKWVDCPIKTAWVDRDRTLPKWKGL